MDRSTAIGALATGNSRERLAAARILQREAQEEDLPALREALEREAVAWIRSALEAAIERGERRDRHQGRLVRPLVTEPTNSGEATASELVAQIRDEVTHRSALTLVHILDPIVGSLRLYAAQEVPNFDQSETSRTLDQLVALLQSIHRLGRASAPPKLVETSISSLLADLKATEFASVLDRIELSGADSIQWVTDPALLGLIVGVALRNAIEAADDPELGPVECEWAIEAETLAIRVRDRGRGLVGDIDNLFDAGVSTKSGHSGLGLAVARQAARSLHASIDLRRRSSDGTVFELVLPTIDGGAGADPGT